MQCNERVKVLYILLCNIFNHMKKYKFQTDPSSEFQTRSSSELVSWHRTYFSKLDPVRNSELGAVWKMLPFQIMLHCTAPLPFLSLLSSRGQSCHVGCGQSCIFPYITPATASCQLQYKMTHTTVNSGFAWCVGQNSGRIGWWTNLMFDKHLSSPS